MAIHKNQYAIETVALTKVFPDWWGRAKVVAVDNLNLKVKHNEIYGLLGPNGSGKTTTLKMLLGLLHPSKGNAFVLDGVCSDPKISARVGYLPEDSYLYKYLSARETLDFYGRIFGLPSDVRNARIDALLDMVGLAGMTNRPVGTYSKGMARRIGLAQALINDPELLILDEPTSGMDPIGNRQMKDLFLQLVKRGKTILLCSHLLADVEDVCDRIGILYGGKMQVEGAVDELLKHTHRKQILTDSLSDSALDKIRQIVQSESSQYEITSPADKLEDFFVRTVTAAQEQKQQTSGAVSKTGIGKFLIEEKKSSDILDELVSSKEKEKDIIVSSSETATSKPTQVNKPDQSLLDKLTKTRDDVSRQGEKETSKTENIPEDTEKIKRDVLDELMGRSKDNKGLTEQTKYNQTGEAQNE